MVHNWYCVRHGRNPFRNRSHSPSGWGRTLVLWSVLSVVANCSLWTNSANIWTTQLSSVTLPKSMSCRLLCCTIWNSGENSSKSSEHGMKMISIWLISSLRRNLLRTSKVFILNPVAVLIKTDDMVQRFAGIIITVPVLGTPAASLMCAQCASPAAIPKLLIQHLGP